MQTPTATAIYLTPNGNIPNHLHLPLLLYRQVFADPAMLKDQFEAAFRENNWGGTWVNGVFDYHHYHSTAHEALGVLAGSATILFGGPGGEAVAVQAGDLVVLPAGTGHCRQQASPDFKVIGAYPKGQEDYDLCTEDDEKVEKLENIRQVALPTADPVAGEAGPLVEHWKER